MIAVAAAREEGIVGVPGRPAFDHEQVLVRRGDRSGVHVIIAVHSTALGPSLGGCRMRAYASVEDAIDDALRLSQAMTLKAAAAGLPLGGGKAVICLAPGCAAEGPLRDAILRDFADALNQLAGRYITAEDVGTTSDDMALLSACSPHVVGRPPEQGGAGDPGDFTAAGVMAAMRACCTRRFGSPDPAGRSVSIIGCGSVGGSLARRLHAAGAELLLSDIDEGRRVLARELGARWASPEEALLAPVDILAPCALGGVIDAGVAAELRCAIVCGAANNQLTEDAVAVRLAARGIVYAPDFIVNAGGLINVYLELPGYDAECAERMVEGLEMVVGEVLDHAAERSITPLAAAAERARLRLDGA
ncbi:MAG: amino acid dehydrogenase [Solirubrobacteraceae bacterium]